MLLLHVPKCFYWDITTGQPSCILWAQSRSEGRVLTNSDVNPDYWLKLTSVSVRKVSEGQTHLESEVAGKSDFSLKNVSTWQVVIDQQDTSCSSTRTLRLNGDSKQMFPDVRSKRWAASSLWRCPAAKSSLSSSNVAICSPVRGDFYWMPAARKPRLMCGEKSRVTCAFNSRVGCLTGGELQGWVTDPRWRFFAGFSSKKNQRF